MSEEKNKRDVEYYLGLPYTLHIEEQKDEDGHFFYAYISELGKYTCYGVGKSVAEALKSLREVQEVTIEDILKAGKEVPLPKKEEEGLPSGKFMVRTSPRLHAQLVERAKEEGISLNLLVNLLLAQNLILRQVSKKEREKGEPSGKMEAEGEEGKPITLDPEQMEKTIKRKVRIREKGRPFEGIVKRGRYRRVS